MTIQPTHQHEHKIWVLVADGKQAHAYVPHKLSAVMDAATPHDSHEEGPIAQELVPVPALAMEASSHANSDSARLHFMKEIALELNRAYSAHAFDRLVLAAPAKMIGELRSLLPPELQRHIAAVLPKDLTHYHGHTLLEHLQDTITEAQLL